MTATLAPPAPPRADPPDPTPPAGRRRLTRLVRGRADDPSWARPALLALLVLTGVLYTWDLAASGYANSFYAAAVQSGTQSWKAWFFGSLDSGNSITVDKPPAALWVMGLSARLFGFGSWSLLVPQALEGVASVALLYGAVRRVSGHGAGLLAGAVLALTPAAVLMFRFDNPDALLTLLLTAGAYAMVRALEGASVRWVALAGTAIGFAFLTKMLQGLLVLPAFALVYLLAAPTTLRRRLGHVLLGGVAVVVSAGWWVAAVSLWPASSRPYIGGSTDNTVLDLVFGYNGFGRLLGGTGNGGGGGTQNSGFGGATGLGRLFSDEFGNEISWLLPAALVALVAGLLAAGRRRRTDPARASLLLWGGWLLVTAVVFSYMQGTVHPYYSVALAPAVAAVLAVGGSMLWRARVALPARVGLAAVVAAAGSWSAVLLGRTPSWHPELRWVVLALRALAMAVLLVPVSRLGRWARAGLVAAVAAGVIGTGAFGVATAATAHTGSIPSVGPAAAQTSGMGGGGMGGGATGRGGAGGGSGSGGAGGAAGSAPTGRNPSGTKPSGAKPSGAKPSDAKPSDASTGSTSTRGNAPSGTAMAGGGTSTSAALVTALEATSGTWAAAVSGDQSAAELELATGKAVIAIGGWSGSDASPTLAQFQAWVKAGRIGYYIASGTGGMGGSSGVAAQIAAWVKAHYTATTIGTTTVYKLTS